MSIYSRRTVANFQRAKRALRYALASGGPNEITRAKAAHHRATLAVLASAGVV